MYYKKELEIMQNWMPGNALLVSIDCCTYNQEKYITQAIESFLMQKTSFPFEIIIHDDASTDNTANIIREYETQYPLIIKPIYQTENQYTRKNFNTWRDVTFPLAQGKYIAICEGDDYWTDPMKLQKQVDLIEKYPNASMCVALNKRIYEQTGEITIDSPYNGKHFPLIYFKGLNQYFHTSTYLFRKSTLDILTEKYPHLFQGDTAMRYLLINEGPFVVLNDLVSVYRITGLGVWSSLKESKRFFKNYKLYKLFRKHHKSNHTMYYLNQEVYCLAISIKLSILERMKR